MFTIIGGDGKEYGPATVEQLRTWINNGRANLDTKAKALGTEEWRRLGDFAEFATPDAPPPIVPPQFVSASAPAPAATAPASGIPQLVLADQGIRLGARVIDWILMIISIAPGFMILGAQFIELFKAAARGQQPDVNDLDIPTLMRGLAVLLVGWFVMLVVQVVLLSMRGQSVGKLITGLRVVRVVDGSQAGFLHAWLLRECVITIIGVVPGLIPFIGPFIRIAFHLTDWCFVFREDRRCLHDLIAGTKVVKI